MHGEFSGSFPDYTIFTCKFETDECFLFMKRYKLETFKKCKAGKAHDDYDLSYVVFDQQLKIPFRKSQAPLKKSTPPFLLTPPPKSSKSASPPLFANIENFSGPPAERGGEDTDFTTIIHIKEGTRLFLSIIHIY